jgi:hypothetical protein
MTVAKLLAPFAPFYADQLYKDLGGKKDSVHLDSFPVADESLIDKDLEDRMEMAQKITSMVLALRRKVNIKVRQPLQSIMIPATEEQKRHIEAVKNLIMSEVNVKELKFVEGQGILVKKVKCNFRTMGKKYGKLMKGVAAQMDGLSQQSLAQTDAVAGLFKSKSLRSADFLIYALWPLHQPSLAAEDEGFAGQKKQRDAEPEGAAAPSAGDGGLCVGMEGIRALHTYGVAVNLDLCAQGSQNVQRGENVLGKGHVPDGAFPRRQSGAQQQPVSGALAGRRFYDALRPGGSNLNVHCDAPTGDPPPADIRPYPCR